MPKPVEYIRKELEFLKEIAGKKQLSKQDISTLNKGISLTAMNLMTRVMRGDIQEDSIPYLLRGRTFSMISAALGKVMEDMFEKYSAPFYYMIRGVHNYENNEMKDKLDDIEGGCHILDEFCDELEKVVKSGDMRKIIFGSFESNKELKGLIEKNLGIIDHLHGLRQQCPIVEKIDWEEVEKEISDFEKNAQDALGDLSKNLEKVHKIVTKVSVSAIEKPNEIPNSLKNYLGMKLDEAGHKLGLVDTSGKWKNIEEIKRRPKV